MSLPHAVLSALLGLGLVHAELRGQDQWPTSRPTLKLKLGMEFGLDNVKTGSVARFQNKLTGFLKRQLREQAIDAKVARFISLQGQRCLPLRLQLFTTVENLEAKRFLIVVDSAAPLNLSFLTEEAGTQELYGMDNAWTHDTMALRQFTLGDGRSRVLMGNVFGDRPEKSPLFLGRNLPEPRRLKKSLLRRLRKAPYYAMVDGGVLTRNRAQVQRLTALVGRHGTLVGVTLQEVRGRLALDVIWGVQPGQGLIGMFLPKKPSNAKVLGSLPFSPSFMVLANLGRQGRQGMITALRAAVAGGGQQPALKPLLELLDCWDGEAQFMCHLPDPAAAPLTDIRPNGRKSTEPLFGIVLKVEEDSEATAIRTLKQLIPAIMGVPPQFLVFSQKDGVHAVTLGRARLLMQGADGLVVLAMSQNDRDCRSVIDGVREQFPVHTTPARVAATRAPVKVFVSQRNLARLTQQHLRVPDHIAARGELHAKAYTFGQQLASEILKLLITDDIVYSVSWNRTCMRMRLQF